MYGRSQNGPTVNFSREISRMHRELCNFPSLYTEPDHYLKPVPELKYYMPHDVISSHISW